MCHKKTGPEAVEISVSDGSSAKIPKLYTEGNPAKITYEQVTKIKKEMTFGEVAEMLGPTKDIGSGRYVLQYQMEDGKSFGFSVSGWDDAIGKSGKEMIEELKN